MFLYFYRNYRLDRLLCKIFWKFAFLRQKRQFWETTQFFHDHSVLRVATVDICTHLRQLRIHGRFYTIEMFNIKRKNEIKGYAVKNATTVFLHLSESHTFLFRSMKLNWTPPSAANSSVCNFTKRLHNIQFSPILPLRRTWNCFRRSASLLSCEFDYDRCFWNVVALFFHTDIFIICSLLVHHTIYLTRDYNCVGYANLIHLFKINRYTSLLAIIICRLHRFTKSTISIENCARLLSIQKC